MPMPVLLDDAVVARLCLELSPLQHSMSVSLVVRMLMSMLLDDAAVLGRVQSLASSHTDVGK